MASNLVPGRVAEMVESFKGGDEGKAKRIEGELMPLFKALFIETNPGPVKMAMNWVGMAAGKPRLPLVELEPGNQQKLREVLRGMGLLKAEGA